jgi:hypothetical protein
VAASVHGHAREARCTSQASKGLLLVTAAVGNSCSSQRIDALHAQHTSLTLELLV